MTGLQLRFISKLARLWATVDRFPYELVIDKDLAFKLFFQFQVIFNDCCYENDMKMMKTIMMVMVMMMLKGGK